MGECDAAPGAMRGRRTVSLARLLVDTPTRGLDPAAVHLCIPAPALRSARRTRELARRRQHGSRIDECLQARAVIVTVAARAIGANQSPMAAQYSWRAVFTSDTRYSTGASR